MDEAPKILLLDDEPDVLEYFREILGTLKSRPRIVTSDSGARAITLLEAEPFHLLISDLRMPKMDGLQVLSIVRRRFPQLRVMILSAIQDDSIRSRAYAMGVDLYWEKPATAKEVNLFTECVESLLSPEAPAGFRGIQSKSLVDLVQIECLSQNSCTLRITHGKRAGQIWIINGEVADAETGPLSGEAAFKEIFRWRTGNFETLPADPARPRRITASYQGLLLDSAQAMDEARDAQSGGAESPDRKPLPGRLAMLARMEGVEFLLETGGQAKKPAESWGLDNPEPVAAWADRTISRFRELGEALQAGPLDEIEAFGAQQHLAVAASGGKTVCAGFRASLGPEETRESMRKLRFQWAS